MRLPPTLLLLLSLLTHHVPTFAARTSATSFCKCVCFTNSTIIALNPPTDTTSRSSLKFSRSIPALHPRDSPSDDSSPSSDEKQPHHHKPTCADCNRAFCLNQGLKICENAKEEDVFATCFRTPGTPVLFAPISQNSPSSPTLPSYALKPNPLKESTASTGSSQC
jgi:hypothetical protein